MYIDQNGREIPSSFIHKIDRDKDAATRRLVKKAKKLSEQLAALKEEILSTGDALYARNLEEKKVTLRENSRGGYSLMTIDKSLKVSFSISDTIRFNDNIDLAQAKIKDYLAEVTKGVNEEVHLLIDEAFKTRRGQLDTARVLGLLKLNIQNPTWMEAMELIRQSIEQVNTKRYVQVYEKDDQGEYRAVRLDFAGM